MDAAYAAVGSSRPVDGAAPGCGDLSHSTADLDELGQAWASLSAGPRCPQPPTAPNHHHRHDEALPSAAATAGADQAAASTASNDRCNKDALPMAGATAGADGAAAAAAPAVAAVAAAKPGAGVAGAGMPVGEQAQGGGAAALLPPPPPPLQPSPVKVVPRADNHTVNAGLGAGADGHAVKASPGPGAGRGSGTGSGAGTGAVMGGGLGDQSVTGTGSASEGEASAQEQGRRRAGQGREARVGEAAGAGEQACRSVEGVGSGAAGARLDGTAAEAVVAAGAGAVGGGDGGARERGGLGEGGEVGEEGLMGAGAHASELAPTGEGKGAKAEATEVATVAAQAPAAEPIAAAAAAEPIAAAAGLEAGGAGAEGVNGGVGSRGEAKGPGPGTASGASSAEVEVWGLGGPGAPALPPPPPPLATSPGRSTPPPAFSPAPPLAPPPPPLAAAPPLAPAPPLKAKGEPSSPGHTSHTSERALHLAAAADFPPAPPSALPDLLPPPPPPLAGTLALPAALPPPPPPLASTAPTIPVVGGAFEFEHYGSNSNGDGLVPGLEPLHLQQGLALPAGGMLDWGAFPGGLLHTSGVHTSVPALTALASVSSAFVPMPSVGSAVPHAGSAVPAPAGGRRGGKSRAKAQHQPPQAFDAFLPPPPPPLAGTEAHLLLPPSALLLPPPAPTLPPTLSVPLVPAAPLGACDRLPAAVIVAMRPRTPSPKRRRRKLPTTPKGPHFATPFDPLAALSAATDGAGVDGVGGAGSRPILGGDLAAPARPRARQGADDDEETASDEDLGVDLVPVRVQGARQGAKRRVADRAAKAEAEAEATQALKAEALKVAQSVLKQEEGDAGCLGGGAQPSQLPPLGGMHAGDGAWHSPGARTPGRGTRGGRGRAGGTHRTTGGGRARAGAAAAAAAAGAGAGASAWLPDGAWGGPGSYAGGYAGGGYMAFALALVPPPDIGPTRPPPPPPACVAGHLLGSFPGGPPPPLGFAWCQGFQGSQQGATTQPHPPPPPPLRGAASAPAASVTAGGPGAAGAAGVDPLPLGAPRGSTPRAAATAAAAAAAAAGAGAGASSAPEPSPGRQGSARNSSGFTSGLRMRRASSSSGAVHSHPSDPRPHGGYSPVGYGYSPAGRSPVGCSPSPGGSYSLSGYSPSPSPRTFGYPPHTSPRPIAGVSLVEVQPSGTGAAAADQLPVCVLANRYRPLNRRLYDSLAMVCPDVADPAPGDPLRSMLRWLRHCAARQECSDFDLPLHTSLEHRYHTSAERARRCVQRFDLHPEDTLTLPHLCPGRRPPDPSERLAALLLQQELSQRRSDRERVAPCPVYDPSAAQAPASTAAPTTGRGTTAAGTAAGAGAGAGPGAAAAAGRGPLGAGGRKPPAGGLSAGGAPLAVSAAAGYQPKLLVGEQYQAKCPDPVQRPQEMSATELAVMGRLVLAHTSLLPSPKPQPQPKAGGKGSGAKGRGASAAGGGVGSKRSRKGSPTSGGAAASADGDAPLAFPAVQPIAVETMASLEAEPDLHKRHYIMDVCVQQLDAQLGDLSKVLGLGSMGSKTKAQWTEKDEVAFAEGVRHHDREFELIQRDYLPHKTMGQLISYYYNIWKLRYTRAANEWHLQRRAQKEAPPAPAAEVLEEEEEGEEEVPPSSSDEEPQDGSDSD